MNSIAVLTSGGDSPGMNACIRAVARTALGRGLSVFGVLRGYRGLIDGDFIPLSSRDVSNIIQRGGTISVEFISDYFIEFIFVGTFFFGCFHFFCKIITHNPKHI